MTNRAVLVAWRCGCGPDGLLAGGTKALARTGWIVLGRMQRNDRQPSYGDEQEQRQPLP